MNWKQQRFQQQLAKSILVAIKTTQLQQELETLLKSRFKTGERTCEIAFRECSKPLQHFFIVWTGFRDPRISPSHMPDWSACTVTEIDYINDWYRSAEDQLNSAGFNIKYGDNTRWYWLRDFTWKVTRNDIRSM